MTRSNPYRSAATQIFLGALAAAVLVFAPSAALAQHGGGGGGHMGGGGGGHFGGGFGGGSHASAPAHSAPKAPAHSAPITQSRPPVVASGHTEIGAATARPSLFGAPATSGPEAGLALHSEPAAPRTTVIGFPPSESHTWSATPIHSGPLSFSGQGHDIWQDSPSRGSNVVTNAPATTNRSLFSTSTAPSTIIRPMPPHIGFLPARPPVIFVPAYGYFGPYGYLGYGYGFGCNPFFGFNSGFGCGGFGYGFGYGGGYGYGGYGGYYGSSYGYGADPGDDDSSNSVNASPDEGYGPYSSSNLAQQGLNELSNADSSSNDSSAPAAVAAAPDATPAPAPAATTIWLKDGTSYEVMSYWLDAGKLHYITNYGGETSIDMSQLDLQRTVDENALRGVNFTLRPAPAPAAAPSAPPNQQQ